MDGRDDAAATFMIAGVAFLFAAAAPPVTFDRPAHVYDNHGEHRWRTGTMAMRPRVSRTGKLIGASVKRESRCLRQVPFFLC